MATQKRELTADDSNARKFNHNLIQLFEQLSKVYPDDRDLKVNRDKIAALSSVNAKMPSEFFILVSNGFIKEIMTRDQDYFINFNYGDNMGTSYVEYKYLIDKIINYWLESTSEQLKETIWKYLQVLLVYAVKSTRRHDLAIEINKYRTTPIKI